MTREEVKKIVIAEFNITETELQSKSRKQKLVSARQVYSYLCRNYLTDTFREIGQDINKSCHSIMHNLRAVRNRMTYNDPLVRVINKIENQFLTLKTIHDENKAQNNDRGCSQAAR
jgi:chromosomal replication initiator protein